MIALFLILLTFFFIALALAGTIFWIWMIVDCAQNRYLDSNTRIVWILVIVFTHLIGALIYLFAGRRPHNAAINVYPNQMNVYANTMQGSTQYSNNQGYQSRQQPYVAPNANNYRRGYQGQPFYQAPQQFPPASSSERQYYESPQASYPQQQTPKPQE
jgi:hypothetical protein